MYETIKKTIEKINSLPANKPIKVISHNDTDGITSAAIFSRTLQRWNKNFSVEIIKNLHKEYIESLEENQTLIFLDLASGSLGHLEKKKTEIFILDHHEIPEKKIPDNITIINPILFKEENICSAAICYLFAKSLSDDNKDLSHLAVIGMVGDMHESCINKTYSEIIKDADITIKKGILLYPATRPLDRVLENSFGLYIPGVTGSFKGTLELLREARIEKTPRGYKSIAELSQEEMSRLTTTIMLKKISKTSDKSIDLIGNIYLTKFFNRLEDARELSALLNACSRMDHPESALGLCLNNKIAKKGAEKIYAKYKKTISSALEQVQSIDTISGKSFLIINAEDKIKDTIIGTIASIMSFSPLYEKGTIIVTMAHSNSNKIKVSCRNAGREGRNVRKVLDESLIPINNAEIGGHPNAAGCLIHREDEKQFIANLKKVLEVDMIKV